MSSVKKLYQEKVIKQLMQEQGYKNVNQVPKITKITLNIGVGDVANKQSLKSAVEDLTKISAQQPVVTKARKSIAGFKIREGWPIGCKVTLRKKRMYDFLERLLYISLPRIRDFRGLNPKSFDGNGNFSLGVKEQIAFPEIDYEKIDKLRGLDITICTTANSNKEALALLKALKFPFKEGKAA